MNRNHSWSTRWTRPVLCIALFFSMMVSLSPAARAQNTGQTATQIQQFRPWADPNGLLQSQSAENMGQWNFLVGLYLNYSKDPITLRDVNTGDRIEGGSLINHQVGADLVLGIGLLSILELSVAIPMSVYQVGQLPNTGQFQGLFTGDAAGRDLSGFAFSDIKIGLKSGFLNEKDHGVNLGLQAYLGLPTGDKAKFNGDDGITFGAALLFNKHFGPVNLAVNFGYRFNNETAIIPRALVVSHELFYSAGISFSVVEKKFDLLLDLAGAANFTGDVLSIRSAPFEALIAGRYYPMQTTDLALTLGFGLPFTPGYGTPQFRVFFGATWAPREHDRDGDGVMDEEDKCPDTPGAKENPKKGCPWGDADGDGLKDNVDKCPRKPGPKENQGCPDTDRDGDGIVDRLDKCPDVKGVKERKGCPWPDTDKDGLKDNVDKCPRQPGPRENNGCPWGDTDGDGLKDNVDRCPKRKGPKENKGCPDTDRDNDGIVDRLDKCPDVPGVKARQGCPKVVLVKKVGKKIQILKKIFFRTGSARIRRRSLPILDQVASVMKSNPKLIVQVEGHTDNRGGKSFNTRLSKRRAASVVRYLTKRRGVKAERLKSEGFGPDKPIESNRTRAGRAKNRRVEFNIIGGQD